MGLNAQGTDLALVSSASPNSCRLKPNPPFPAFDLPAEGTAHPPPGTDGAWLLLLYVPRPSSPQVPERGWLLSSSSSPHGNGPRIVPVLLLIAVGEQTVSLILPYRRARWRPRNSPELSQPTASFGAAGSVHIWPSLPRGWVCVCFWG